MFFTTIRPECCAAGGKPGKKSRQFCGERRTGRRDGRYADLVSWRLALNFGLSHKAWFPALMDPIVGTMLMFVMDSEDKATYISEYS